MLDKKARIKEYNKEYYIKNKERILKQDNTDIRRKQMRERAAQRRKDVINHYGGICICCGETIFEFLGIDHIDGGGIEHRKAIGMSGGSNFYGWIRKNNYPDGFQVLCHNCNMAKGFYGICPHKILGKIK